MEYDLNGAMVAANENGYLEDETDWTQELGVMIAETEEIEMTDKHWDVVNYLRSEFLDNHGNQPNMRNITKAMQKSWGDKKVDTKAVYALFPAGPSKQAGKIAGLPESRRKGGY